MRTVKPLPNDPPKGFDVLAASKVTQQQELISELQSDLVKERDARKEDQFVFLVLIVILLDIVFFSLMPTYGGPIALLVLELLILIPLAKRMGMEEVAQILSRVLNRMAGKVEDQ